MAEARIIISDENLQNVLYKNAMISKVHDDDVYDIKFTTGKIKNFVENTSGIKFNSGDYVAVLLSENSGSEICKILGRGRRIQSTGSVPIIRV